MNNAILCIDVLVRTDGILPIDGYSLDTALAEEQTENSTEYRQQAAEIVFASSLVLPCSAEDELGSYAALLVDGADAETLLSLDGVPEHLRGQLYAILAK